MSQTQDLHYTRIAKAHGATIDRLARGYERDPERARDLVQTIHVELWRSLSYFDGQCSERSWVFRIAHNVAVSHVLRERRLRHDQLVSLDEVELPSSDCPHERLDRGQRYDRLLSLVHQLKPADRQVLLLHLEDLTAAEIADVLGLSPGNVAVRLHRAKALLSRLYGGSS